MWRLKQKALMQRISGLLLKLTAESKESKCCGVSKTIHDVMFIKE